MSRDQIVEVTYKAADKLNRVKYNHKLISEKRYKQTKKRIENSLRALEQTDEVFKDNNMETDRRKKPVFTPHYPTICEKDELEWPVIFSKIKLN